MSETIDAWRGKSTIAQIENFQRLIGSKHSNQAVDARIRHPRVRLNEETSDASIICGQGFCQLLNSLIGQAILEKTETSQRLVPFEHFSYVDDSLHSDLDARQVQFLQDGAVLPE